MPKQSSTSRKLLLDDNDGQLAKGKFTSSDDDEQEYEWKVVCWIDSKVCGEDNIYINMMTWPPLMSSPNIYSFHYRINMDSQNSVVPS